MSRRLTIAVDPATTTGLAWTDWDTGLVASMSLRLAKESELRRLDTRFFDPRPVALRRSVVSIINDWSVYQEDGGMPLKVLIGFEDVQFAHSLAQVQLWGSLRGALWTLGEEFEPEHVCVAYVSVPTGTLKKHATGNGSADKKAMAKFAARYWPNYTFADDNEVDARMLWRWIETEYPVKGTENEQ
jgi:hypothetical protein